MRIIFLRLLFDLFFFSNILAKKLETEVLTDDHKEEKENVSNTAKPSLRTEPLTRVEKRKKEREPFFTPSFSTEDTTLTVGSNQQSTDSTKDDTSFAHKKVLQKKKKKV